MTATHEHIRRVPRPTHGRAGLPWERADDSIAARFERVAAEMPDHIAIDDRIHSGVQVSYRSLNDESNRLAHRVIEILGPKPAHVALLCRDDLATLPAFLALAKANKTCVPLESDGPELRTQSVIEHSEARLILSIGPSGLDAPVGELDIAAVGHERCDNPGLAIDHGAPARILYTSGSTGAPKGVVWSHRFVIDKNRRDADYYGYTPADRLSQMITLSFGMSELHAFGALFGGGTVVPYEPARLGFHGLADWIDKAGLTGLAMAPSLFRRFLERREGSSDFETVRYVWLAGEASTSRDLELFQRHFHRRAVLINQLAATECGPISRFIADHDTRLDSPAMPAGWSVPGKQVTIVDEEGRDVGTGEAGELEVRAEIMPGGYWNDDGLTAAAFKFDRGGRGGTYRTGDLARINADGSVEHLGRKNARVKVRGYGVDLREVEYALLSLAEVAEAVATVRHTDNRGEMLVAHVVVTGGGTAAGMRARLGDRLPSYSIPSHIMVLDEMPLTERGKLDRAALPAPVAASAASYSAPTDDLETAMVEIWQEVLSIERVGIDDPFVELGGTSIQALEAFAELHRRHDLNVPPTTLLDAPTIRTLAAKIHAGEIGDAQRSTIVVASEGSGTPFFCVHGGGGGIFFLADIANNLAGNRPVIGIQATGFEGTPPPYRPVKVMAGDYIEEMKAVQKTGPYMVAGLSFGGLVAHEMAQQLLASGEQVAFLGILDTQLDRDLQETRIERLRERTASMSAGERGRYLLTKVWGRLVGHRIHRRRRVKALAAGESLPMDGRMREQHFWSMHRRAGREYEVSPTDAPLCVIAAEGLADTQRHNWGTMARGGIEVFEVPANHFDMMREPAVAITAGYLQDCMDTADPRLTVRS